VDDELEQAHPVRLDGAIARSYAEHRLRPRLHGGGARAEPHTGPGHAPHRGAQRERRPRRGSPSALGISFGLLVHVAALAPGLAAPPAAVPAADNAVRLAGALYLLALGAHLVLRPRRAGDFASPPPARRRAIFSRLQRLTGAVVVGLGARLALSGNR
jgi:threonine/homoserine/homoserine lactone efflux protein